MLIFASNAIGVSNRGEYLTSALNAIVLELLGMYKTE